MIQIQKMMMSRFTLILIFFVVVGCSKPTEELTSIRYFNAMNSSIEATIKDKDETVHKANLEPYSTSPYQSSKGSKYSLMINDANKMLLDHEYGFAGDEKYSVILFGKPEFSSRTNQSTFTHNLHHIFAGAENYTTNGFLPSIMVFRDKVKLKEELSSIRSFHAAPGVSPVSIQIKDQNGSKTIAANLKYAKPIMSQRIRSGKKKVELYLANAPEPVLKKEFDFKSKNSYLIIVIENKGHIDFRILESSDQ